MKMTENTCSFRMDSVIIQKGNRSGVTKACICEDSVYRSMAKEGSTKSEKSKHYFFLNPYKDGAFTKCPRCDSKTKIRKFPLVVHVEPQQLVLLNKKCRYCTACDLIIARQSELETLMVICLEDVNPDVIGNDYLTMGVVERKDWREVSKAQMSQSELIDRMYVFKGVLDFKPIPAWTI